MSPVVVWTLSAILGIAIGAWNGYWSIHDFLKARRSNGSPLRLPRIVLAKHNLGTEVMRLVSQMGFLYVGVKSWGVAGAWNDVTVVLVLGAASLTVNTARGAWIRYRLNTMLDRAEPT